MKTNAVSIASQQGLNVSCAATVSKDFEKNLKSYPLFQKLIQKINIHPEDVENVGATYDLSKKKFSLSVKHDGKWVDIALNEEDSLIIEAARFLCGKADKEPSFPQISTQAEKPPSMKNKELSKRKQLRKKPLSLKKKAVPMHIKKKRAPEPGLLKKVWNFWFH